MNKYKNVITVLMAVCAVIFAISGEWQALFWEMTSFLFMTDYFLVKSDNERLREEADKVPRLEFALRQALKMSCDDCGVLNCDGTCGDRECPCEENKWRDALGERK